jgi:Stress responsive A/B Barrel Domain
VIKHIVLWKLKRNGAGDPVKREAQRLKEALEGLRGKIPEIQALEVGLNFNPDETASDLSLYTEFADRAGLDRYQRHPEHRKVAALLREAAAERRVSDYEVDHAG